MPADKRAAAAPSAVALLSGLLIWVAAPAANAADGGGDENGGPVRTGFGKAHTCGGYTEGAHQDEFVAAAGGEPVDDRGLVSSRLSRFWESRTNAGPVTVGPARALDSRRWHRLLGIMELVV
ncbi:hypothetical protein ACFY8B_29005 [Streptomyces sp. NPDC012751]|uniref:hypothetical protein n=1 Tax=Streptomyces sp. NPDC012751 TaxID=3364846 RepID=UPI0036CDD29F